ncbi:MAG: serine hydrolase [Pseudomonadota bacterium]
MTKAYASLILGRAMALGYLTMADLDRPLVSFLSGLDPTTFADGAETITLHQALTMRSGMRLSDEQLEALRENPSRLEGSGLVPALFESGAPISSESQTFFYQGIDPELVMQVIEAIVPGTAEDFIKTEFLGKMGITNYTWQTTMSGLPAASSRARIISRAMVKIGQLVMNNGEWQGEQLIAAPYLAKATSGLVGITIDRIPDDYVYGYYWHRLDAPVGDQTYEAQLAWGGGGQRVLVLPELDLIVVMTGHDRDDTIMDQITRRVVPAFAP